MPIDISQLAAFIASNAPGLLVAAIVLLLIASAALRWAIERHGEKMWRLVSMVWQWLDRYLPLARLNRYSYIAVHLAIGFALTLVAAGSFIALADEISEKEEITQLDFAVADAFRNLAEPLWLERFLVVTRLGNVAVLIGVAVVVFVVLMLLRRRLYALCWLAATLGNGLLIRLLKAFFGRERPMHDHGLVEVASASFPSGHAAGSLVVYGMLAYLLLRESGRRWHPLILGVAVSLIAGIGFSRVVLHVHFLSDVLAGYSIGLLWLTAIIAACEIAMTHHARRAGTSTE